VKFKRGGRELTGYPALVDNGENVDLRLLDAADAAEMETRRGVVRLLRLALSAQFKQLDKDLSRETALALKYPTAARQLRANSRCDATRALLGDDDTPRAKTFDKQKERAKRKLPW
jgi:ATP-dependent helicase HrpA